MWNWGFLHGKSHHPDDLSRCGKPNHAAGLPTPHIYCNSCMNVWIYVCACKSLCVLQRVPSRLGWSGGRLKEECTCISRKLSPLCSFDCVHVYCVYKGKKRKRNMLQRNMPPQYHCMQFLNWRWTLVLYRNRLCGLSFCSLSCGCVSALQWDI